MSENRFGHGDRKYPETSLAAPKEPIIEAGAEKGAYGPAIEILQRMIKENSDDGYKLTFVADSKSLVVRATFELTPEERIEAIKKPDDISAEALTDLYSRTEEKITNMRKVLIPLGFDLNLDKKTSYFGDDSQNTITDVAETRSFELVFEVKERPKQGDPQHEAHLLGMVEQITALKKELFLSRGYFYVASGDTKGDSVHVESLEPKDLMDDGSFLLAADDFGFNDTYIATTYISFGDNDTLREDVDRKRDIYYFIAATEQEAIEGWEKGSKRFKV